LIAHREGNPRTDDGIVEQGLQIGALPRRENGDARVRHGAHARHLVEKRQTTAVEYHARP
jgi:hypothetical protein